MKTQNKSYLHWGKKIQSCMKRLLTFKRSIRVRGFKLCGVFQALRNAIRHVLSAWQKELLLFNKTAWKRLFLFYDYYIFRHDENCSFIYYPDVRYNRHINPFSCLLFRIPFPNTRIMPSPERPIRPLVLFPSLHVRSIPKFQTNKVANWFFFFFFFKREREKKGSNEENVRKSD